MFSNIVQSPSTLVFRGIIALLFGVVALMLPLSAFWALVLVFGVYAFIDGVSALIAALTRRDHDGLVWLVVEGFAGIIAGILTFVWPRMTAVALIAVVSAWALITGALKIVLAIELRKVISGEWLLVLSGAASIALGVLIIITPLAATLALIWMLGIFALVLGGSMIALSVRVRRWEQSLIERLDRTA